MFSEERVNASQKTTQLSLLLHSSLSSIFNSSERISFFIPIKNSFPLLPTPVRIYFPQSALFFYLSMPHYKPW